jgi:hypothetical protein
MAGTNPLALPIGEDQADQLIAKIATASAHEFFVLLRNWTGFDARIFHHQRLEGIITAAIIKHRANENFLHRYHTDARFHLFVETCRMETLQAYKEAHQWP